MADSLDLRDRLCDVAVWECCLKARGVSNGVWLLQAVHSGADLQASAKEASRVMPQGAKDHLGYVLGHQGDHEVLPLMQNAVEARTEIAQSGQLPRATGGAFSPQEIITSRPHHMVQLPYTTVIVLIAVSVQSSPEHMAGRQPLRLQNLGRQGWSCGSTAW